MERSQENTELRVLNRAFDSSWDSQRTPEYISDFPDITPSNLRRLKNNTEEVLSIIGLPIILKLVLKYYTPEEIKEDLDELVRAIHNGRGKDYNFEDDEEDE